MRFKIRRYSDTHKNWVYIKNEVIGGLRYSWCHAPDELGIIYISLDEDLRKTSEVSNIFTKGVNLTTGSKISAETFIKEVASSTTLKRLIENILDETIFYRGIGNTFNCSSSPTLGDICMGFTWSNTPEGSAFWDNIRNKLEGYERRV